MLRARTCNFFRANTKETTKAEGADNAYVLALSTVVALCLNKANVLALNKAHVWRLNKPICQMVLRVQYFRHHGEQTLSI